MLKVGLQNEDYLRLVNEWHARARAVAKQFAYKAASKAYEDLKDNISTSNRALAESLQFARVTGLPDSEAGFVIRAVPEGTSVEKTGVDNTLVYVSAKPKAPRSALILEEHSPWPVDMLPYEPPSGKVDMVSRRVSPRVVARVREVRKRDRPVWRRKMNEAGLREIRKDQRLDMNRRMKAVPDVAFDSIRLEFGLGGTPPRPHWRPAILQLASRGGAGKISRQREFFRAMTDPTYMGWKKWPSRVPAKAGVMELKRYVPFEKKLGLRIRRK